jgi:hypothetical protein
MPTPAEIDAAGPWAVLVFVLISGIVGLFVAFAKEAIVSGPAYRRLLADWQVLKDQGDRNAKALEAAAAAAAAAAKAAESRDRAAKLMADAMKVMADRDRAGDGTGGK